MSTNTITFNSNFGRFAYAIVSTIAIQLDALTRALTIEGLANLGFRGCASDVEKALVKAAVPCDSYEKKVDGKLVTIPAGPMTKSTPRSAIIFSPTTAAIIAKTAQAKLDELASGGKDGEGEKLPTMQYSITGEHEIGSATVSRKMATEMWNQITAAAAKGDVKLMIALGLSKDTSEDVGIEKCHQFLASFRTKK